MCDGQEVTLSAPSRNIAGYLRLSEAIDRANPTGDFALIMDNLSSHTSGPISNGWRNIRAWRKGQFRRARAG